MSRRPNRSVLVERGAPPTGVFTANVSRCAKRSSRRERQRLGLPPPRRPERHGRQARPGRGDGAGAGTHGPVARSDRRPSKPPSLRSSRARSPTGATARAYAPSSKPGKPQAGARRSAPPRRVSLRGSAGRARDVMNGRNVVLDRGPAQCAIVWIAGDCGDADALN